MLINDMESNSLIAGIYKICCVDVPEDFFTDKSVAKHYFRQFGRIKRMIFKRKLNSCSVEYYDHHSFSNALNNAGEYNGKYFSVSYDNSTTNGSSSLSNKSNQTRKDVDKDWLDDPDVRAELEVMGGLSDVRKSYNLRPEKMSVDPIEPPKLERGSKFQRTWKTPTLPKMSKKKKAIELEKSISVSPEQLELINLLKQQATTIDEKYRILDARDKLIRLRLKRNMELKSTATVGVCPDMCPEKERLMRETQHQVALYEQEEGGRGMNPSLAVKQYSRSSADQEAPLPHELRPVSVLKMTMGYLMHNIMNMCDTTEVNLGEWFHFLWDRTRGIRKDITQQELCSQGSVELVEQCARFHILCSARLVAEDPSVFDQKINTENLTKCLQTLKYMYHDLQLKGESCPHEAEFRAYIILLNLNDGNFMWEVQQLRPQIQKSQAVKFALDVYSALDKNNYVKFFKLVNRTTYLNACILMRYFVQVRISAMSILLKCYSPPSHRANKPLFPLVEFTRILAFEDVDSAVDFLVAHGLQINAEQTHALLDKHMFTLPDYPYVLDRAINVIESKRKCLVGEVVCGKPLTSKEFLRHIPQNSFDERGYLILDQYLTPLDLAVPKQSTSGDKPAVKEEKDVVVKPAVKDSVFVKKPEPIPSPFMSKSVKDPAVTVFGVKPATDFSQDETDKGTKSFWSSSLSNIVPESKFKTKTETAFAPSLTSSNIFGAAVLQPVHEEQKGGFQFPLKRDVDVETKPWNVDAGNVITNQSTVWSSNVPSLPVVKMPISPISNEDLVQKRHEEQLKRRQEEAKRTELLKKLAEEKRKIELERQKLLEAKMKKAEEMKKLIEEKRRQKLLEMEQRRAEALRQENERQEDAAQRKIVAQLLDDLVEDVVCKTRAVRLREIQRNMQYRTVQKMVKKWQEIVSRNKRKRKAIDCSPVFISAKTSEQEAMELRTTSQDLTLKFRKRYKYGTSLDIPIVDTDRVQRINLFQLTYSILSKRLHTIKGTMSNDIFWKVTVSLPDANEMPNGLTRIEETLQRHLRWSESHGQTMVIEQVKANPMQTVTYCVNKQQGLAITDKETNGIIFVADEFDERLQQRILEYLGKFRVYVKIPIVILLQKCDQSQANLKTLIAEKIISDYLILVHNFTPNNFVEMLDEGLQFLAGKVEGPPPLELDTFKSFVTKHLCTETWKKANSFAKWNSSYEACLRNPNVVISLYNEGVDKLKAIARNWSCPEFAKFPTVFKEFLPNQFPEYLPCPYQYFPTFWSDPTYAVQLGEIFDKLILPPWTKNWPPTGQYQMNSDLFRYCMKITNSSTNNIFVKLLGVTWRYYHDITDFDNIQKLLWTDMIEVISLEMLNVIDLSLKRTIFHEKSIFSQLIVVYNANALKRHRQNEWFYINHPVVKDMIAKTLAEKPDYYEEFSDYEEIEEGEQADYAVDLQKTLTEVTNQLQNRKNMSKMNYELEAFNLLMQDLETSIHIHREISSKSLQKIIDEP